MPELREEFAVKELYIFGSVARGDDGPESDVDVLVEFEPGARVTLVTLARVSNRLERLLHRGVDIVEDHPRLRPSFRAVIEGDKLRVA